jgi:DNA-binding MarR family transcriptional regulator/GNAT superfamily N-acetyltransferase
MVREIAAEHVAAVRAFNRTVTQRLGVLADDHLDRGRPLGASRVLWELGDDGTDLRSLRERLGLDSGYLSRLVRTLRDEGLVEVVSDPGDRRVRIARPTDAGRREQADLDAGSDDLARSLLAPLSPAQQDRLLDAMGTVDRLLTASLVAVDVADPVSDHARHCLAHYYAELDERMATGFDVAHALPYRPDQMRPPAGLLLVARRGDTPLGCGALKFHDGDAAEVKRVWVDRSARGLGLGRRLMDLLEGHARAAGVRRLLLDTNSALVEAIALYRATGWVEVEAFNDEPHADHWFAKDLDHGGRRA